MQLLRLRLRRSCSGGHAARLGSSGTQADATWRGQELGGRYTGILHSVCNCKQFDFETAGDSFYSRSQKSSSSDRDAATLLPMPRGGQRAEATSALLLRDAATNTVSEDAPPQSAGESVGAPGEERLPSAYAAGAQALAEHLARAGSISREREEEAGSSDEEERLERAEQAADSSETRMEGVPPRLAPVEAPDDRASSEDDDDAFAELYRRHGLCPAPDKAT